MSTVFDFSEREVGVQITRGSNNVRAKKVDKRVAQPPLEVADIIRSYRESFEQQSRGWISWQRRKVVDAIVRCRTAALGGHRDRCSDCGHVAASYNSCGNRHCPKCQGNARLRWIEARQGELLPTRYMHAVFIFITVSITTPSGCLTGSYASTSLHPRHSFRFAG